MLWLTVIVWVLFFPRMVLGQCIEGSARLRILTSSGPNAGLFEICVGNKYGTVQLDSSTSFWSEKNALVACQQLGFEGALNTVPPSQLSSLNYASSSVPVHYSSVTCLGTESSIANCSSQPASTTSHNTDVFLVCWPSGSTYTDLHSNVSNTTFTIGSIRLVGESPNGRGVVEILTVLGWSTICPDSIWTNNTATDMCQYLGYESGTARTLALDSALVSPRLVRDPECLSVIEDAPITRIEAGFCNFLSSTSSTCSVAEGRYAAVTCTSRSSTGTSRLFGLDTLSSTRLLGIIEYFANGRWGVVCRPSSTSEVDESICDGFGYNRDESSLISLTASRTQMVESRMKPLWIPDVKCDSSDRSLAQCSLSRPLGYGTCGSTRDILAVDCGPKSRPFNRNYIAAIVVPPVVVIALVLFLVIKREEWLPRLKRCTCKCWSYSPRSNRRPVATQQVGALLQDPTGDENSNAGLSEPLLSHDTSSDIPFPKENLPPPYSPIVATPSAPPPDAYPIPQGDPAYLPPLNPAYPPGASPYPSSSDALYPPGAALPYPTSLADQTYPPPSNVATDDPPASYPPLEKS